MKIGSGRQMHANPIRAPHRDCGVGRLQQKAGAVLDRTAIAVGALVGAVLQKLVEQVAVGAMKLYAIKAGGLRELRGLPKRFHDIFDFELGQGAGRDEWTFGAEQAHMAIGGNWTWTDRAPALVEDRVGNPAGMPDLHKDPATGPLDYLRYRFPSGGLLLTPNPGHTLITDRLFRDRHSLRDDKTGGGTLAIVFDHKLIGDVRFPGAQACQRRHNDAIWKSEITQF